MVRMIKHHVKRFVDTPEERIAVKAAKNAPKVNALYRDPNAPNPANQPETYDDSLDRHQPARGRHRMDLIYSRYGCSDPRLAWGFDDTFPDCLSGRMKLEQWKDAYELLNDGYLRGSVIKLVWIPAFVLGLVGAVCEGALRAGKNVPTGQYPSKTALAHLAGPDPGSCAGVLLAIFMGAGLLLSITGVLYVRNLVSLEMHRLRIVCSRLNEKYGPLSVTFDVFEDAIDVSSSLHLNNLPLPSCHESVKLKKLFRAESRHRGFA
jgi:hypothetical protein